MDPRFEREKVDAILKYIFLGVAPTFKKPQLDPDPDIEYVDDETLDRDYREAPLLNDNWINPNVNSDENLNLERTVSYYEPAAHDRIQWTYYGWVFGKKYPPSDLCKYGLNSVDQFMQTHMRDQTDLAKIGLGWTVNKANTKYVTGRGKDFKVMNTTADGTCLFHAFLNATFFKPIAHRNQVGVNFRLRLVEQFNHVVDRSVGDFLTHEKILTPFTVRGPDNERYAREKDVAFLSIFFRVNIVVLYQTGKSSFIYDEKAKYIYLFNPKDFPGGRKVVDHFEFVASGVQTIFNPPLSDEDRDL